MTASSTSLESVKTSIISRMAKLLLIVIVCVLAGLTQARNLEYYRRFLRNRGFLIRKRGGGLESCLQVINGIRAKHGADPLKWNNNKQDQERAQEWAEEQNSAGKLSPDPKADPDWDRELSAMVPGGGSPADKCKGAVRQWYAEKAAYKSGGGCGSDDGVEAASAFSQLVWKTTEQVFVAVAGNVVEAKFHPPGNIEGDFGEDVQC